MGMLKISLPDSLSHEYAPGTTVGEVRNAYGKKSGAVAALVDGEERISPTFWSRTAYRANLGIRGWKVHS